MSEVAVSDRPTMAEAFAAPDSQTGTPAVPESTPAGATDQTGTTAATTSTEGPIPLVRHKEILDGAYKERDGYKQQLDALSWAQQVDRAAVEEASRLGQLYQRDRAGYIRSLLDEALTDADLAPVLRSEFGRRLGQRTGGDAEIEPDIPVYDANGQQVSQTYSAKAVQQIVQRAIAEAIGKEVTPIKQTFATQQAQRVAAERQQQMTVQADRIYSRAEKTLPQFKEHEQAIATAMTEFADADPSEALYLAWAKVVLPKLQQTEQAQVLASLEKKAAAATVSPNAAVVTTTHKPTSLLDKSLKW